MVFPFRWLYALEVIGGFLGKVSASTLSECHVVVSGSKGLTGKNGTGGFAGFAQNSTLKDFSAKTNVNALSNGAGLIAQDDGGTYSNGAFDGDIIVTDGSGGGFAAVAQGYEVSNVSATGDITCTGEACNVGGIIAISKGSGKLSLCNSKGNLSANNKEGSDDGALGGIIGSMEGGSSVVLENCFSKGKLKNVGNYTGGIVGKTIGACISNMESCSHFGDIEGKDFVGGLIGALVSDDKEPTLCKYEIFDNLVYGGGYPTDPGPFGSCYHTNYDTIINGEVKSVPINNCVSIGNLEGGDKVGGLIGSDLSSYGYYPDAITTNSVVLVGTYLKMEYTQVKVDLLSKVLLILIRILVILLAIL